jgi:hypothetical protein
MLWEHIAREAGHDLSFEGISRERMIAVSIAPQRQDLQPLHRMFEELLDPVRASALRTATRFLERYRQEELRQNRAPKLDWQERYVSTTAVGQHYRGVFVTASENHFIALIGQELLVGDRRDLPDNGKGLDTNASLNFVAQQHDLRQASSATDRERRECELVLRSFRDLAARRAWGRPGYQDQSKEWLASPEKLREKIDGYNALQEAERARELERLVQHPQEVRDLKDWMEQRQQKVKELGRGMKL